MHAKMPVGGALLGRDEIGLDLYIGEGRPERDEHRLAVTGFQCRLGKSAGLPVLAAVVGETKL